MRPIRYTYAPTALDRDGIGLSQTPAGAGALTLAGTLMTAGVVALGAPQFLTVYSASNISNRTITFTGVNYRGDAISETITGPNNETVKTTKSFASGSLSATISGAAAGAIEVGVDGTGNGQPLPVDYYNGAAASFSVGVSLPSGAGPTWTVQVTLDDVFASTYEPNASTAVWYDAPAADLVAETTAKLASITQPVAAFRIQKTAGTGAPGVAITIVEQNI